MFTCKKRIFVLISNFFCQHGSEITEVVTKYIIEFISCIYILYFYFYLICHELGFIRQLLVEKLYVYEHYMSYLFIILFYIYQCNYNN